MYCGTKRQIGTYVDSKTLTHTYTYIHVHIHIHMRRKWLRKVGFKYSVSPVCLNSNTLTELCALQTYHELSIIYSCAATGDLWGSRTHLDHFSTGCGVCVCVCVCVWNYNQYTPFLFIFALQMSPISFRFSFLLLTLIDGPDTGETYLTLQIYI